MATSNWLFGNNFSLLGNKSSKNDNTDRILKAFTQRFGTDTRSTESPDAENAPMPYTLPTAAAVENRAVADSGADVAISDVSANSIAFNAEDEGKRLLDEFCETEFGKKCAKWLEQDLQYNGPLNLPTVGQLGFVPKGIKVKEWLNHFPDLFACRQSGLGGDFCEAASLSPDARPVRTKVVPPEWMTSSAASAPKSAAHLVNRQAEGVKRPPEARRPWTGDNHDFAFGRYSYKEDEYGVLRGPYVTDAVLSDTYPEKRTDDIPVPGAPKCEVGEYVVALCKSYAPSFIFANGQINSPVQVLKWSLFKESEQESSAEKYFTANPSGSLAAENLPLIGNKRYQGQVVIAGGGNFFKGFHTHGDGKIEYSRIARFTGDWSEMEKNNQASTVVYWGKDFRVLVPEKSNPYGIKGQHSVIDHDKWVPLDDNASGGQTRGEVFERDGVNGGGDESEPAETPAARETSAPAAVAAPAAPAGRVNCSEQEERFLKEFIDDVAKCGYEYAPQDLVRFHTSVKCGAFTLLGGAPGCGKSTLASLYARALLGDKKANAASGFLSVDVNPAWMEPNDILGHWTLNGRYSCASSGLVEFLRRASSKEGTGRVNTVCLEEMNLARVEHYFSDFLQLMSRPPNERVLFGIPKDSADGADRESARLLVPENLRFVGTNNSDETTQRFSARFYDRCNYIELRPAARADEFPSCVASPDLGKFDYGVTYSDYVAWCDRNVTAERIVQKVRTKFKALVELLKPLNLAPSPRIRRAMLEYIVNRPFFEDCGSVYSSDADCQMIALDEAVVQRILPRYSVNYLRDETGAANALQKWLEVEKLPLSKELFASKLDVGEKPVR